MRIQRKKERNEKNGKRSDDIVCCVCEGANVEREGRMG